MTDTELLAHPYWETLTDSQLRRAVILAKSLGRKTFELLQARAEEQETKIPPASIDLYGRHCVLIAPKGKDCWEKWEGLKVIEMCADPRMFWFCTLYDQAYRRQQGLGALSRDPQFLRTRANYAGSQFEKIRAMLAGKVFLLALAPAKDKAEQERQIAQHQEVHDAAMNFSLLTLMEFNARMDDLIS